MPHFVRIRPAGLWTIGSVLQPEELELFDANQSKALNGDEGGVWAPSALLELGGAGLKVTGPLNVPGAASFTGGVLANTAGITGSLDVQGDTELQADLEVQGETGLGGAPEAGFACKVTGNAKCTGTLAVSGDLTVASDLDVQQDITAQGAITGDAGRLETLGLHSAVAPGKVFTADGAGNITGNWEVGGVASAASLVVSGNATISGTTKAKGRFKRRVLVMTDAGTTVSVSDHDLVYMPPGVMSADRTLTVSTSGAEEGDVLRVVAKDTIHTLDVDWGSDASALKRATDKQDWLELTFIGGVWIKTGTGDRSALRLLLQEFLFDVARLSSPRAFFYSHLVAGNPYILEDESGCA